MRPAPRLLVLADYDGTLTPIVARPESARLPAGMRATLQCLNARPGIQVGVISGRALRDVKRQVRLPGVWYAGNHGLELEAGRTRFVHPAARRHRATLQQVARRLRRALRGVPGAWVESKGLTCSVHWRAVPPRWVPAFNQRLRQAAAPAVRARTLECRRGKRVVELRPKIAWDKGRAVAWLQGRCGAPPPLLVYLGDDKTDEDAFRMVNRRGGVSVFVGPLRAPTRARFGLRNPAAVQRWLARLGRALA